MGKSKHSSLESVAPKDQLALSPDEIFDRYARELTVLFGWFFTRHLHDLYHAFNGDLLLPLILGEIAHHNICRFFTSGRRQKTVLPSDWKAPATWSALEPCNALSLSDAIGIPRETCRRKVRELCRLGYIQRHPRGGYVFRPDISTRFRPFNRKTFTNWMGIIAEIQALTAADPR